MDARLLHRHLPAGLLHGRHRRQIPAALHPNDHLPVDHAGRGRPRPVGLRSRNAALPGDDGPAGRSRGADAGAVVRRWRRGGDRAARQGRTLRRRVPRRRLPDRNVVAVRGAAGHLLLPQHGQLPHMRSVLQADPLRGRRVRLPVHGFTLYRRLPRHTAQTAHDRFVPHCRLLHLPVLVLPDQATNAVPFQRVHQSRLRLHGLAGSAGTEGPHTGVFVHDVGAHGAQTIGVYFARRSTYVSQEFW